MKYKSKYAEEIARMLVKHFGVPYLVQTCRLSQPAVASWQKNGIPYSWESFFRKTNPELEIWTRFPEE